MIEGLKMDITSDALATVLNDRATFHSRIAGQHRQRREAVGDVETDMVIEDEIGYAPMTARSVKETLSHSIATHERKAAWFTVVAKHLIPNEVYRLDADEVTRLEMVDKYL